MKRSYQLVALASGACISLLFAFVACQSSDTTPPANTGGSSQGGQGGGNVGGGGQGGGNVGGGGQGGGNVGGGGQGGGNVGGSGQGGSAGGSGCMAAQAQTVEAIAMGAVGPGIAVQFTAIAETAPILTSSSKKSGSCGWGVFVKDPTKDFATLLYAKGDNMPALADGGVGDCPMVPVFAGIQPGDVLNVTGTTDAFVLNTCTDAGAPPAAQIEVKLDGAATACLTKTAGTAPTPVKVTDIDGLALGKADFQALLVELDNVKAEDWSDGGPVGAYGVIKIKGTNQTLEIHDKFYYPTEGSPQYASGTTFNKIVGVLHLDYCTWAIQPIHKCTDLDPKSSDCP